MPFTYPIFSPNEGFLKINLRDRTDNTSGLPYAGCGGVGSAQTLISYDSEYYSIYSSTNPVRQEITFLKDGTYRVRLLSVSLNIQEQGGVQYPLYIGLTDNAQDLTNNVTFGWQSYQEYDSAGSDDFSIKPAQVPFFINNPIIDFGETDPSPKDYSQYIDFTVGSGGTYPSGKTVWFFISKPPLVGSGYDVTGTCQFSLEYLSS